MTPTTASHHVDAAHHDVNSSRGTQDQARSSEAVGAQPSPEASEAEGSVAEEASARQEGASAPADGERQRLEAELEATRRRVDELARAYQARQQGPRGVQAAAHPRARADDGRGARQRGA